MSNLDVFASQLSQQLHVVIAGHTKSHTGPYQSHYQAKHLGNLRPTINQVSQKDNFSCLRLADFTVGRPVASGPLISKLTEQGFQFVKTSMDVADDVERSFLMS